MHESFDGPVPTVYKLEQCAYLNLCESCVAVMKVLESKKEYLVLFQDEDGNTRTKDRIIAISMNGCRQGRQIGAGSLQGTLNEVRWNCHISCDSNLSSRTTSQGLQME